MVVLVGNGVGVGEVVMVVSVVVVVEHVVQVAVQRVAKSEIVPILPLPTTL